MMPHSRVRTDRRSKSGDWRFSGKIIVMLRSSVRAVLRGVLALLLVSCGNPELSTATEPAVPGMVRSATTKYSCLSAPCIYMGNIGYRTGIHIYALDARGRSGLIGNIVGRRAQTNGVNGVAVDSLHQVYVANLDYGHKITVYPAGKYGNVKPIRRIEGSNTRLDPAGVAVDANENIYAANNYGGSDCEGSVTIYAPGYKGNVKPTAEIEGLRTKLCRPYGVALDSDGNIYVVNQGPFGGSEEGSITVYAAGSNGNVAPTQRIMGSMTQLYSPVAIAVDQQRNVYVSESGAITVYKAGATGNVSPIQEIAGALTKLYYCYGLAVDANQNIYATNYAAADIITVYSAGATGNVPPVRTIRTKATSELDAIAIR